MAGTTVGKLNALLTADTSQFDSKLSAASVKVQSLSGLGTEFLGGLGVTLGVGAIATGLKKAVEAAEESYQVQRKLESVLDATGHAAGFTAKQLTEYAGQLSRITSIDDEAIIGAQTLLATFQNIRGDTFTRATDLALDMATVMGTDAASAAQTLGKALASPADASSKLSRAGIVLDESQKQAIKTMIELGDVAGAQGVILDALAGKFENAAEKSRSSWKGLQVEFENYLESLGKFATTEQAGGLVDWAAAYFRQFGKGLDDTNKLLSETIGLVDDLNKAFMPDIIADHIERMLKLPGFIAGVVAPPPVPPVPNLPDEQAVPALSDEQVESIEKVNAALQRQIDTLGMTADAIKLWELEQQGIPDAALDATRELLRLNTELREEAQVLKVIEAAQDASRRSIESTVHSLEEQRETMGMSAEQIQLWKLQVQGADAETMNWARTLSGLNAHLEKTLDALTTIESKGASAALDEFLRDSQRLEEMADRMEISEEALTTQHRKLTDAINEKLKGEAERIHEMTRTPFEKAQEEIENLNRLLEQGWIPLEDYNRRVQQIEESLTGAADEFERLSDLKTPALEFGTAAAFSATGPRDVDSVNDTKDVETHKRLDLQLRELGRIGEKLDNLQPIYVGSG